MPLKHVLEIEQTTSGKQKVSGIEGKFMQLISKSLGFQYRLVVPEDKEWGRLKNGSWTGLIGMIVRGEADMALTYLSITEERMKAVNFSTPYVLEDLTFATNLPGFLNGMPYLRPFHLDVWLCCLGLLLIIPAVFCVLLQQKYGYINLLIKFYGSCLKQPLIIKETAFHIRLLFGFWCFLSMLISLSYTALLSSFVTLPTVEDPLRNLQELAEAVNKGKYKCFIARGSSDLDMLLNSENESIRRLGELIISHNWYMDSSESLSKASTGENIAVLGQRTNFYFDYGKDEFATKYISKNSFAIANNAIALKSGFCCKAKLNSVIEHWKSAGIYQKLLEEELHKTYLSNHYESPVLRKVREVHLRDVSGALIMLIAGCFLSVICLCVEVILNCFNAKADKISKKF